MRVGGGEGFLHIPSEADCIELWDSYGMWDNIRAHSRRVADLALALARQAVDNGEHINPDCALAAGLLHDLGKAHSIEFGGFHDQLGAAWVMRETRNGPLAQAVLYHTFWPWDDRLEDMPLLTKIILYADKRVRHDQYVSLDERFRDLMLRYGLTETARGRLSAAHIQGKTIEAALSSRLGVKLDEYTAHSGRLVRGT